MRHCTRHRYVTRFAITRKNVYGLNERHKTQFFEKRRTPFGRQITAFAVVREYRRVPLYPKNNQTVENVVNGTLRNRGRER